MRLRRIVRRSPNRWIGSYCVHCLLSHPFLLHRYRHPGYIPGMEGVHLPPGIIPGFGNSSDPLEVILGIFPCVRVRGIHFDAAIEDVLMQFQGFVVLDVVLNTEAGEAFVVFSNPMDYQMALQRYVEECLDSTIFWYCQSFQYSLSMLYSFSEIDKQRGASF